MTHSRLQLQPDLLCAHLLRPSSGYGWLLLSDGQVICHILQYFPYLPYPTTRIRNSCTPLLVLVTKNPDGNISETKRAIRDPLVSKQLEQNSEYEEEEKIGFLKQAQRAQSRPVMPQPRSRAPEGPLDF